MGLLENDGDGRAADAEAAKVVAAAAHGHSIAVVFGVRTSAYLKIPVLDSPALATADGRWVDRVTCHADVLVRVEGELEGVKDGCDAV